MVHNNYSPAFCALPVQKSNLIKIFNGKTSTVDVTIEQINRNCPEDFKTVKKIVNDWSKKDIRMLAQCFHESFLNAEKNSTHFWIKTADNDIAGVLQTTNPETSKGKRIFKIGYLISKPTNSSDNIKYKGAGKIGILQAVKMAKENGFKSIRLFSTSSAIKFYEKLGFKKNTTNPILKELDCFELNSKNFDSLLKNNKA